MKRNLKAVVVFYFTLISICFITGVSYCYSSVDNNLLGIDLIDSFKLISFNNLLVEVGIISISFLLSSIFIGNIIFIILIVVKSFSTGFIICSFVKVYSLSGLFVGLIYFLLFLLIHVLLFILMVYMFNMTSICFKCFFQKNDFLIDSTFILFKRIIIIFICYVFYNFVLFFTQDFILNFFRVLLV